MDCKNFGLRIADCELPPVSMNRSSKHQHRLSHENRLTLLVLAAAAPAIVIVP